LEEITTIMAVVYSEETITITEVDSLVETKPVDFLVVPTLVASLAQTTITTIIKEDYLEVPMEVVSLEATITIMAVDYLDNKDKEDCSQESIITMEEAYSQD